MCHVTGEPFWIPSRTARSSLLMPRKSIFLVAIGRLPALRKPLRFQYSKDSMVRICELYLLKMVRICELLSVDPASIRGCRELQVSGNFSAST